MYAWNGIIIGFKTQLNLRIQVMIFLIVCALGIYVRLPLWEMFIVLLCSACVIVAELINSAIEMLVDMVSPEWRKEAGRIKDVAAGAVLVAAAFSFVIGLLIFGKHFGFL